VKSRRFTARVAIVSSQDGKRDPWKVTAQHPCGRYCTLWPSDIRANNREREREREREWDRTLGVFSLRFVLIVIRVYLNAYVHWSCRAEANIILRKTQCLEIALGSLKCSTALRVSQALRCPNLRHLIAIDEWMLQFVPRSTIHYPYKEKEKKCQAPVTDHF
jgi:hypothetical protein